MCLTTISCKGVIIRGSHKETCGKKVHVSDAHAVKTPNHGTIYLCEECFSKREGYTIENSIMGNSPKKHGFTYSVELELTSHDDSFCRYLQYNDFLPTYDSTVAIEYKSKIYQSLNGIRKVFRSIYSNLDYNQYFAQNSGTHLNIGNVELSPLKMSYIRRFYNSLFVPLSDFLQQNPNVAKKIFGRELTYWACAIGMHTSATNHENFINMQHDTHIEFRLAKFVDEKQFVDLMQLCTRMMKSLINNFVEHFDDDDFTKKGFAKITDYRKYKAQITAQKIVEHLKKECDKKGIAYRG